MAYNVLGTRYTHYVRSGTSTPSNPDIRGWGKTSYEQTASDLANNQSKVKIEYGSYISASFAPSYMVAARIQVKNSSGNWVDAARGYKTHSGTQSQGTYSMGTITATIPHDLDGTKKIRTYITIQESSVIGGSEMFQYVYTLPTIAPQATITNVTAQEMNLSSYGVSGNTYVNQLSQKQYTITLNNPGGLTVSNYFANNGDLSNTSSTNNVTLNFANKDIVTTIVDGIKKPVINVGVTFTNSGSISGTLDYGTITYINYHKPQFIPTSCTTKRNGQLSGKVNLDAQGTYFNGDIGTESQGGSYKPTVGFKKWVKGGTEPSSYTTIPATNITVSNGSFSIHNYEIGTDFNYNNAYYVKLKVNDKFASTEYTCNVTRGTAIWTEYSDRVDFIKATVNGGTTTIDSTGTTTNKITAGNIDCGTVSITPVANTPTKKSITFNKTFSSIPVVTATAESAVIGTTVHGVSVANVTTTGCDIYIYRTNTTSTNVNWIAML